MLSSPSLPAYTVLGQTPTIERGAPKSLQFKKCTDFYMFLQKTRIGSLSTDTHNTITLLSFLYSLSTLYNPHKTHHAIL